MTLEDRVANLEEVIGLHVTTGADTPTLRALQGILNALDDLEDRVTRLEGGGEAPKT